MTKRNLDLALAVPGFLVASPLLCFISLVIRLTEGKPVLFKQVRPGKDGKPFVIYKFRTMSNARGPDGQLLPDEKRLTPLGKFLRDISLDELPELFNVLKGDMSIVEPRPLLTQYLDRYTPEWSRRHKVKSRVMGSRISIFGCLFEKENLRSCAGSVTVSPGFVPAVLHYPGYSIHRRETSLFLSVNKKNLRGVGDGMDEASTG